MAVEMQQERQFDGADQLCRRILELAPEQPDALHLLGLGRHHVGRTDEGVALIRKAIELEPSFAGFWNNLGNIHATQGDVERATAAYERAIELAPDSADLHNNLGALYKAERRFGEAQESYERALSLDPLHMRAHNNLGLLCAAQGDLEGAVRHYIKAIGLMPGQSDARHLLGLTYYTMGKYAEAGEVFRQWTHDDPDHPVAGHMHSALSGVGVPERAPNRYVEHTFDRFADSFESTLNERLNYRAPQLCAELLAELLPAPSAALSVLDAGCGTGLCGPLIAPWARTLAGVDLSRGMLDRAQTKGVYSDLYKAELTEFLRLSPAQWDVVLSADTLCYFGDLHEVAAAAAQSLRPSGWLVFTVEALADDAPDAVAIQPSGRYAHTRRHIETALGAAGLVLSTLRGDVLRQEGGKPVQGWLVAARAPATEP